MDTENSIGQELAKIPLRPAIYDELSHEVQVGARIDIVSDAGGDDAEDGCGASAARPHPARTLAARPVRIGSVRSTRPCFGCLIPLAWVGLIAHFSECRSRTVTPGRARIAFIAYSGAAILALASAGLGLAVAAFRTF